MGGSEKRAGEATNPPTRSQCRSGGSEFDHGARWARGHSAAIHWWPSRLSSAPHSFASQLQEAARRKTAGSSAPRRALRAAAARHHTQHAGVVPVRKEPRRRAPGNDDA